MLPASVFEQRRNLAKTSKKKTTKMTTPLLKNLLRRFFGCIYKNSALRRMPSPKTEKCFFAQPLPPLFGAFVSVMYNMYILLSPAMEACLCVQKNRKGLWLPTFLSFFFLLDGNVVRESGVCRSEGLLFF